LLGGLLRTTADLAQTLPPDAVNFGNADLAVLRVPLLVDGLDRGSVPMRMSADSGRVPAGRW
jgi:hypothetical protein